MKRIIALLLILVICAGLFSCMPNLKKYVVKYADGKVELTDEIVASEQLSSLIDAANSFAINLMKSVEGTSSESTNLCISPISLYMSLATACESASGETREQILAALGITYEQLAEYTRYYYALCNKNFTYTDTYGAEQISAHERLESSVWVSSQKVLKPEGVDRLTKVYNCNVFAAPFDDGTAKSIINQYIGYISHNIITGNAKISTSSDISFISAHHLKEIWNEFGRNLALSIERYDFINSDASTTSTQMLKSTYTKGKVQTLGRFSTIYAETEHGYKIHFVIPAGNLALKNVFTPYTVSKILSIEDYGFIDNTNSQLNYTRLIFPQLNLAFNGDISENLKTDFGITSLFDPESCDLSNLVEGSVRCDEFIHVARLRLNAKGIEGESINLGQSQKEQEILPDYEPIYQDYIIDRSFGFILTDPNGVIVYIGEVNSLN